MNNSNIKDNPELRNALIERWTEKGWPKNGLTNRGVLEDANEKGIPFPFTEQMLSRYIKNKDGKARRGALSDEQTQWLATRWGVYVSIDVGVATIVKDKVRFKVPPYNEKIALELVNLFYGKK